MDSSSALRRYATALRRIIRRPIRRARGWLLRLVDNRIRLVWEIPMVRLGLLSNLAQAHWKTKQYFTNRCSAAEPGTYVVDLPSREELLNSARAIHGRTGLWPISFSYPFSEFPTNRDAVARVVSEVVPGAPYSFWDEGEYLETYSQSALALTHLKGGWDCLRHLEIIQSGSIPLLPDSESIPSATMFFYPKEALAQVYRQLTSEMRAPSRPVKSEIYDFAIQNLSCRSMAEYILHSYGSPVSRVLFVDRSLATKPDYLSVFSLIGLKQVLGRAVEVAFDTPYVYDNFEGPTASLYGRGFGYVRKLPANLKSNLEKKGGVSHLNEINLSDFDLVVVGSVTRNQEIVEQVLGSVPRKSVLLLHGEDKGPSFKYADVLRDTGATVFVRELDENVVTQSKTSNDSLR